MSDIKVNDQVAVRQSSQREVSEQQSSQERTDKAAQEEQSQQNQQERVEISQEAYARLKDSEQAG